MIVYQARADLFDADEYSISRQHIDVYEPDRRAIDAGLLDQFGTRIFRHEVRHPIGFRVRD